MTRNDITSMAREAGLINSYGGRECASDELLAHFAALVAAKAGNMLLAGSASRDRCSAAARAAINCAAAIRGK